MKKKWISSKIPTKNIKCNRKMNKKKYASIVYFKKNNYLRES